MTVTKKSKETLLRRTEGNCEFCNAHISVTTVNVDHIIPLNKGGTSDIDNLVALCRECNLIHADKIIREISNPVIKPAAKLWLHSFIKFPKSTSVISFVSVLAAIIAIWYTEVSRTNQIEHELSKNQNFNAQIEQLNKTEESLKTLMKFVSTQKNQVIQYKNNIEELEIEQDRLRPLVNADKDTVNALLSFQNARAQENSSREKWIGFALGIVASIIASFVMVIGKYFIISRRKNQSWPIK